MKNLLAIDLETTGLDPETDEITEVGAILLTQELKTISTFQSLVKPSIIPAELPFSNIDPKDLCGAPEPEVVLNKLQNFVKRNLPGVKLKDVVLFGQNPQFDKNFLTATYKRIGKVFPFDYHVVDLVSFYVMYSLCTSGKFPEELHLKDLAAELETNNPNPHRALSDISVTVGIAKHLIGQLCH